ncbi:hypothetical protein TrCOL_g12526 [Triparma columacea]|uniref:Uncharacterized protein n=1 Tax=Triparma columacea TaxID=722753 RepID=A0A9W7FYY5_9STRA|nr:hypothetical protein TrCOL_g12526 [Triparma columacea]
MIFLLISKSAIEGSWRYFAAGGICASFSHAVATPIDVIKTRQQVDEGNFVSHTDGKTGTDSYHHSYGIAKTIRNLMKEEGTGILLAGLGPTTIGYFFEGALKFGIYEILKPFLCSLGGVFATSKLLSFVIAGGLAGIAASIVLCPMEALRIRLVSEPHFTEKGWVDGGVQILRNEGVGGLAKGINAMLFKQVPYTIVKQVSFDFCASFLYSVVATSVLSGPTASKARFGISLASAFLAAILSCVASQPGDMLLSVVNAHKGKASVNDFIRNIFAVDGIGGFFVGIKARMLHVGLIVTTQLIIYDWIKLLMGIGLTGS